MLWKPRIRASFLMRSSFSGTSPNRQISFWLSVFISSTHFPRWIRYKFSLDRDNNIVIVNLIGRIRPKEFLTAVTSEQLLEYNKYMLIYLAFHATKLTHETGVLVRATRVIDVAGVELSSIYDCFECYKDVFRMGSAYFPEYMHAVVVVNSMPFIPTFFSGVTLFLDPRTRNKIQVKGKSFLVSIPKSHIPTLECLSWLCLYQQQDLTKLIPIECIPKVMGGSCDNDLNGFHFHRIDPGSNYKHKVIVSEANTTVEIEFRTSSNIYFNSWFSDTDEKELKPDRVNSASELISRTYHCDRPGTLFLVFANPSGKFFKSANELVLRISLEKSQ